MGDACMGMPGLGYASANYIDKRYLKHIIIIQSHDATVDRNIKQAYTQLSIYDLCISILWQLVSYSTAQWTQPSILVTTRSLHERQSTS